MLGCLMFRDGFNHQVAVGNSLENRRENQIGQYLAFFLRAYFSAIYFLIQVTNNIVPGLIQIITATIIKQGSYAVLRQKIGNTSAHGPGTNNSDRMDCRIILCHKNPREYFSALRNSQMLIIYLDLKSTRCLWRR
ncbi:hypothetical protein D3C81_1092930 [compost metagenome]